MFFTFIRRNLSNLSIVPIKLIGDNYIYFKNNIPKKVILTTKPLTFSNINDIYYNSSLRGIQDLRTDYCKWIMDIMTKTVWTKGGVINEQRPDIWTEKSLLNYIFGNFIDLNFHKDNGLFISSDRNTEVLVKGFTDNEWLKLKTLCKL